jgi:ubiquinone/menaquinone biosynthesis C-methylase UbiE
MADKNNYIPALRYHWLTSFYDWLIGHFFPEKKFKSDLVLQAGIKNNFSVLDFGCGTATLTLMAKRHHPDARFTGIDVDEKILSMAKKKITASGVEIEVLKYNGGILPFPDGSFDRVITSLVLHHLTPAQRINSLKEINRVLRAGGELHVADWGRAQNIPMRLLFRYGWF